MGRRRLGRAILASGAASAGSDTTYTGSMPFETCTGDLALQVDLLGAKTWTVTQQCSDNDKDWYDPTDGNEGEIGAVASTTTTAVNAWIVPVLAPAQYIRFKVVNGTAGATTYSIIVHFQEEV